MSHTFYIHLRPEAEITALQVPAPFKAIVVLESPASDRWRESVCQGLANTGCLYAMTWGIECEKWHDAIDEANLKKFDYGDIPENHFIITTWHDKEPIEEVFCFAQHSAFHSTM